MITWCYVTRAAFDAAKESEKTSDKIFFLSDTKEIYRGTENFTESVVFCEKLPTSDIALNRLYINSTTREGWIYDGTKWTIVIEKAYTKAETDEKLDKVSGISKDAGKTSIDGTYFPGQKLCTANGSFSYKNAVSNSVGLDIDAPYNFNEEFNKTANTPYYGYIRVNKDICKLSANTAYIMFIKLTISNPSNDISKLTIRDLRRAYNGSETIGRFYYTGLKEGVNYVAVPFTVNTSYCIYGIYFDDNTDRTLTLTFNEVKVFPMLKGDPIPAFLGNTPLAFNAVNAAGYSYEVTKSITQDISDFELFRIAYEGYFYAAAYSGTASYGIAAYASCDEIREHIDNTQNPHGVTAEQTGAYDKAAVDELIKQIKTTHGINYADMFFNSENGMLVENGDIKTGTTTYDSYTTSALSWIESGTYTICMVQRNKLSPETRRIIYALYNSDGSIIDYSNNANVNHVSFTVESDCFIRVCAKFPNETMLISGTYIPDYEAYYEYPIILDDSNKGNCLYGKKWAFCGDSFTAGGYSSSDTTNVSEYEFTNGRFITQNKVYPYFIGLRNNMVMQNLAVGGMTIATPSDGSFTNCFSMDKYKSIAADADYITLWFGINDSHNSDKIPIGTIDDDNNNTFYGAWNVVLNYLITNYPLAHIGIIVSNGCDTADYPNATIEAAKKWGIPYLDLNGDYGVPLMHRTNGKSQVCDVANNLRLQTFRISDKNTHPNTMAHEYESWFIENWLRTL